MPGYVLSEGYAPYGWIFLTLILTLLLMVGIVLVSKWLLKPKYPLCPYTGKPLRPLIDLPYGSLLKVQQFMTAVSSYDNRKFKLRNAAYSRDTGRIFQDCVTWTGRIKVGWNFLYKRHHGYYVSWGSLTSDQREEFHNEHGSLEGYQTDYSCPIPSPMKITPEYAHAKPGPLYVDLTTKVVLGWVCIPDTELEVLLVHKPRKSP